MSEARAEATMHRHRCMRCGKEFDCLSPGKCVANYDVLPHMIVNSYYGGPVVVKHCDPPDREANDRLNDEIHEGAMNPATGSYCGNCGKPADSDDDHLPGCPHRALSDEGQQAPPRDRYLVRFDHSKGFIRDDAAAPVAPPATEGE